MRFGNIVDAIGHTPLVELKSFSPKPGVRIFAKLEVRSRTAMINALEPAAAARVR